MPARRGRSRHEYADLAHAHPAALRLVGDGTPAPPAAPAPPRPSFRTTRRPPSAPARGAEREQQLEAKALEAKALEAKARFRGAVRTVAAARPGFVAPGLGAEAVAAAPVPQLAGVRVGLQTMRTVQRMIAAARHAQQQAAEAEAAGAGADAAEPAEAEPRARAADRAKQAWGFARKMTTRSAVGTAAKILAKQLEDQSRLAMEGVKDGKHAVFEEAEALQKVINRRVADLSSNANEAASRLEAGMGAGQLTNTEWWGDVSASAQGPLLDMRNFKHSKFKGTAYTWARHEQAQKHGTRRRKRQVNSLADGDYFLKSTEVRR